MASYRTHKSGSHGSTKTTVTATIRIPDTYPYPVKSRSFSKSFPTRGIARKWVKEIMADISREVWRDPRLRVAEEESKVPMLHDALEQYLQEVTEDKKGWKAEHDRIRRWQRHPLARKRLDEIRVKDIADYIRQREKEGKAATTIRNDLSPISSVIQYFSVLLELDIRNPVDACRDRRARIMPAMPRHRDRRLRPGEEEALLKALGDRPRGSEMVAVFRVAIETGMRLSEIIGLTRDQIDWAGNGAKLEDTKNSDRRRVFLSPAAKNALRALPARIDGKLFTLKQSDVSNDWAAARRTAGIEDLTFHDLRHEALSRMAARKIPLPIMMMQSGHKTLTALQRYLNPTEDEFDRAMSS